MHGEDCSATNDLDNLSRQQVTWVDSETVEYYVATDVLLKHVILKNTFDTERCPQCSKWKNILQNLKASYNCHFEK